VGADGPVGDVVAAIMEIDSRLRATHDPDPRFELDSSLVTGAPEAAARLIDGYLTVVYLFMTWFCRSYEAGGRDREDALGRVVTMLVSRLKAMPVNVRPSVIPTMTALVTACALEVSPNRWRERYGDGWYGDEVAALQLSALLLAEWINNLQESPDAALRLVMDAYERTEADHGPEPR
jgi:hypothetical protein